MWTRRPGVPALTQAFLQVTVTLAEHLLPAQTPRSYWLRPRHVRGPRPRGQSLPGFGTCFSTVRLAVVALGTVCPGFRFGPLDEFKGEMELSGAQGPDAQAPGRGCCQAGLLGASVSSGLTATPWVLRHGYGDLQGRADPQLPEKKNSFFGAKSRERT